MKILFLTPYIGANYGGTSKAILELIERVSHRGIAVDLVTTYADSSDHLDVPLHTWVNQEKYRIQYFPCWYRHDLIISPLLINWLFSNVTKYHLVHTQTVFAPMISMAHLICFFFQVPYIATPHGMLEPWAMSYKQRKKRIYYKLFEQHLIQKASAVQTLSPVELQNLNSLQIQNTVLVPNGIQVQEFAKLPNSEIFYQDFPETKDKTLILFLGRIDPKKGLNVLAPAFAKVREKFPETHLVIAGPDNIGFLPQVQSYFQQVACLEAVTFTGMLRGNLKYAALAAADLYVAPSYSEGFSMSILEAMASSLPCVITTGCNFPEAASRRAALVVDLSVHNIQNALIYLLQNPDEAKAMGDRARDLIFHNYTWNQSAQKLAQVYQSIIDKRHLPN